MKLFLYFSLLTTAIFSNAAMAEWTPIGENLEKNAATFIDLGSIRKIAGSAEMWSSVSYIKAQKIGTENLHSFRELDEFDCKSKKYRIISLLGYSDRIATGSIVVADFTIGDWGVIPPKTIIEMQWKYACK